MNKSGTGSFLSSPPQIVMLILLVTITIAIGFMIISSVYEGIGFGVSEYTETFSVSDPTTNQVATLEHTPESSTVSVQQYNGFTWVSVGSSYVSVSGTSVTVASGGLQS